MSTIVKLCMFILMCAVSIAHAEPENTRVTAWGKTEEEARNKAFVLAIEEKVGIQFLSDREVKNLKQAKNDIYAYSAGYVSNYKIVSVDKTGAGVYVTVDVVVNSSLIKNRILVENNKAGAIDGNIADASLNTYKNSKEQSDKILEKVLKNYPKNAYVIDVTNTRVSTTPNRTIAVNVNFDMRLSDDFVDNLEETLSTIENPNSNYRAYKIIFYKIKPIHIFNSISEYFITDNITAEIISSMLSPRTVRVNFIFEDSKGRVYSECKETALFVTFDRTDITITKGKTISYTAEFTDSKMSDVLKDIISVRASAVNYKECKK